MNNREISLDIFRGLSVAAMILVNTPGSWSHIYAPLQHSVWHGLTPTDLVFPFFLFAVGNSMYFSFKNTGTDSKTLIRVLKRTLILFGIGLTLNAYPFQNDIESLRIMGVLQRIALCYFIAAILIMTCGYRTLAFMTVGISLGYWFLIGTDLGSLELHSNLVATIDLKLLGATHMYQGYGSPFDPEGLLSTIGATVNVLLGYITATRLSNYKNHADKVKDVMKLAVITLLAGLLWSMVLPINKPLWSSSYALVSSALAQFTLVLIMVTQNNSRIFSVNKALKIYGSNPLFIYVLAWVYASTLSTVLFVKHNGASISVNELAFTLLNIALPSKTASLFYAVIAVMVFYMISLWLYNRKIFIKV